MVRTDVRSRLRFVREGRRASQTLPCSPTTCRMCSGRGRGQLLRLRPGADARLRPEDLRARSRSSASAGIETWWHAVVCLPNTPKPSGTSALSRSCPGNSASSVSVSAGSNPRSNEIDRINLRWSRHCTRRAGVHFFDLIARARGITILFRQLADDGGCEEIVDVVHIGTGDRGSNVTMAIYLQIRRAVQSRIARTARWLR